LTGGLRKVIIYIQLLLYFIFLPGTSDIKPARRLNGVAVESGFHGYAV